MISYTPLFDRLAATSWGRWAEVLPQRVADRLDPRRHGDLAKWIEALDRLPEVVPSVLSLASHPVTFGATEDLGAEARSRLEATLDAFHPWRKGPFRVFGVEIETEWRSDWKWDRLLPHLAPLAGRRVLDVGCGNGYHAWRMAGAGADLVIGIDPYPVFVAQYAALRRYAPAPPVWVLPLGIEDLPDDAGGFDTVFSMGVLSHRRSPMDHLLRLRALLRPGGELVLETLVVEGPAGTVLVPADRYARMRNVWFLPSPETLADWMRRCGFTRVRVVDVSPTTTEEQRATPWMRFESLAEALDPGDPSRTVEGYPAPVRAVLLAEAPA